MSPATETGREIAAALQAEWRMIASVTVHPSTSGDGYEATIRLDPVVVQGSLEQQGHPRTSVAMTLIEARRKAALDDCVRRVNERRPADGQIKSFAVVG